jgi:hypothetical protein
VKCPLGDRWPFAVQTKVRNSGISEDFGVIRSNVIGSPQYSQEGAQIFPFIINVAARVPCRSFYRKSVGGRL